MSKRRSGKKRRPMGAMLLAAMAATGASAQTLEERIAATLHPVQHGAQGPSGPGVTFLIEQAAAADFFLLGESHGNVETPRLTEWLIGQLGPRGYSVLAVETGPLAAEQMKRLAAEESAVAAFQAFHERWPFTIAFFFWKEEVQLLLTARAAGWDVWGLDQEFIGSGRFLLAELHKLVGEDAKGQVEAWQAMATAGFRHFAGTGDSSKAFLNSVDTTTLQAFAESLPSEAVAAKRICEELQASARVYQHFQHKRYFANNRDRIRLMKRHLADYIAASGGLESAPKVLFKFGSAHMGRGYSPFHQLDVGNAAAELAVARGSESFHLNVLTLRSQADDGSMTDWSANVPYLQRFAKAMPAGQPAVFDLRPLRGYFAVESNRAADPELAELVFRFDALGLMPEFTDATPMIPLPF